MGYIRTNIEINEELVCRVMERHGLTTKKEAVDYALHYTAGTPLTQQILAEAEGMGWGGDLDEIRNDHVEII